MKNRKPERIISAKAAIVYNRPDMLDRVLTPIAGKTNQMQRDRLVFICIALQRAKCRKVFLKYGFQENENLTDYDKQKELSHILMSYSCCKEKIVSLIQGFNEIELPYINDVVRYDYPVLLRCLWELFCYIYTCQCLPFNELLSSNCLHQPIKTFAHVTNVV